MLVSLNWLKQYVDFGSLSPEELADKITKSGIEVDNIHYISSTNKDVVVGYVESCEQHPNADKLSLCLVDIGTEKLQIICGAPNIRKGQKVAVAKPGATLPGDFKIKQVSIRDVESNGMICSLQELGMEEAYIPTDTADGIFVFPDEVEVGERVDWLLNLDDAVLEFDLTPNRADALSMIGVAYEVAAILDLPIQLPDESIETTDEKVTDYVSVSAEDAELAPYYAAFIIKDIEVKAAPLWMRNYLIAAGIRPINNVVDITNYVLLEYGQPLHAFDFDSLQSEKIVVRNAVDEEKIVTLDGKERSLSSDHLVITDGENPIALAGVMGGATTEVDEDTKTVLIEAAYFNPASIRKTALDTGLISEASKRFEKGVNPNFVHQAGRRTCQLLQAYANGNILKNEAVFDELDRSETIVKMNTSDINRRLGTAISTSEVEAILTKLRFEYMLKEDEHFVVTIPTRRGDITIFEDMLEEVARIYGYDHLPYTLPTSASRPGGLTERQRLKREVKGFLQSAGLAEAITYSLTNQKDVQTFISPDISELELTPVQLSMPISEDHKYLRLSILPELLRSLTYNRARSQMDLGYYELGSIFVSEEKEITKQPEENLRLAGALTGKWFKHEWQHESNVVDFYTVKGIIEGLFDYLKIPITFKQATLEHMHPGRTAIVSIDKTIIGFLGQVHPALTNEIDLEQTYAFDLNLDKALAYFDNEPTYIKTPRYPSIKRDIAFVINKDVHASDVKVTIKESGAPLVTKVDVFDVYEGKSLAENKKSIAYSLHFQHPEKTLTDEEVEQSYKEVIKCVSNQFDAYVRS